ncbi:MAG: response regulator [Sphaerochaetaceae bacterium]|nr:response regulator [Sphaerochaetaceae bacterium]
MARILAVDDSNLDLTMIRNFLNGHTIMTSVNGEEALANIAVEPEYDLILLDLMMPVMNGFEFLDHLREMGITTPVIILTNSEDVESEILGLEKGAVDYVRKPLNFFSLQKRIELQLRLLEAKREIIEYSRHLEQLVYKRTVKIRRAHDITVSALVRLLETRSIESKDHSLRTRRMMYLLGEKVSSDGDERYRLTEHQLKEMAVTAPLHDIGKVGVPDSILLKPGKLDDQELLIMRTHVEKGVESLEYGQKADEEPISFIETAKTIIATHHEWYDGTGYPAGLAGQQIPLAGRLMAVIDVYDALTHERVYKEAMPHEEALNVMRQESERHFDPFVFSSFIEIADTLRGEI